VHHLLQGWVVHSMKLLVCEDQPDDMYWRIIDSLVLLHLAPSLPLRFTACVLDQGCASCSTAIRQ
jgi:hypothetical protein